jgi:hypothetical protein
MGKGLVACRQELRITNMAEVRGRYYQLKQNKI